MIVGVNGVSEAGKDTVGRVCQQVWGCKRLAFADRMKEHILAIDPWVPIDPMIDPGSTVTRGQIIRLSKLVQEVGWDEAKKNKEVRRLLQRTGTEGGRKVLGEDIWIKQVSPAIRKDRNYVVTDVRFLNEAEWIRNHAGLVVRVERPGYGPALGHVSDVHDTSLWDIVIHNDGTLADLHNKVTAALGEYF